MLPEVLSERPYKEALEAARAAGFTEEEWDEYIRAGMALQDERGALALARREGKEEGRQEGREEGRQEGAQALRGALTDILRQRGLTLSPGEQARLEACEELDTLRRWLVQALAATTAAEALR